MQVYVVYEVFWYETRKVVYAGIDYEEAKKIFEEYGVMLEVWENGSVVEREYKEEEACW